MTTIPKKFPHVAVQAANDTLEAAKRDKIAASMAAALDYAESHPEHEVSVRLASNGHMSVDIADREAIKRDAKRAAITAP